MQPITIQIDEDQLTEVVRRAVRVELEEKSSSVFTKKAAAKFLGMSAVSLWKLERRGLIKPLIIGGKERYTRKSLEDFIQGSTIAA